MKTGEYKKCLGCEIMIYNEPHQIKSGLKKFCSKKCFYANGMRLGFYTKLFQTGHKDLVPKKSRGHTEETKKKIGLSGRGKHDGDKAWNWKGGVSEIKHKMRMSWQWKEWRNLIFKRDGYTCIDCGEGGYLEPHHILPLKKTLSRAFDINNGITLCRPCHIRTMGKEIELANTYFSLVQIQIN